jgi:hypothetical protein
MVYRGELFALRRVRGALLLFQQTAHLTSIAWVFGQRAEEYATFPTGYFSTYWSAISPR